VTPSGSANAPAAEELRRRIEELGPWFHNMTLGGVQTAPSHFLGDYPAVKWTRFANAIPHDLSGRSVLDIGCNAGFYSLEMKRRGASYVLGIDSDARYLEQARFAASYSGLDIEFRQMSVYQLPRLSQRFDVVLFLGVLYHLRHPLLALDLLHDTVVGDLLVVQSMLRGDQRELELETDYPFDETAIFDEPAFPTLHFVEHCYAGDPTNWWIPNRACLSAMLRSAGFAILEHPEAEVFVCTRAPGFERVRED
jgi:tRNA (mo5U34)-methyltransferase